MTPQETTVFIEAAIWRDERAQKQALSMAWHTAALGRAKRIPGLKQVLVKAFPPKVSREEAEKRKRDYVEMTQDLDVSDLGQKLARKRRKRKDG
jgi:hypothetical protein